MKEKAMLFIIGILLGAVVATGAFYIYSKVAKSCNCNGSNMQMSGGQPPEMPNSQNGENGQPPEKPDGQNGVSPEKPNDNNTQSTN